MTEIYLAEDHLLLETGYHDPQMHSHSAAHVLVGLHGDMRVITENETILCRGALLPSGTAHTVDSFGNPLLVFLFDVTSTVSEQIQRMAALDRGTAERIALSYRTLAAGNPADGYETFFMEVMALLKMKGYGSRITDERIIHAMRFAKEHLQDEVTAGEAAEAACLSESRFSHLFREQAGIAFSSWLVYRKLFDTYIKIAEGASITDASLAAGFSTPSHFATTNKRMFGITASDLTGGYRLHRIADI